MQQAKKSILIFGAGKIGRSFIGQLFGRAGYAIVFADIDATLVQQLNQKASYNVVIKDAQEETIRVNNVRAVSASDKNAVAAELERASIAAVCVGKNALVKIMPLLADGLLRRQKKYGAWPLDIIIAENIRSGAACCKGELLPLLPEDYPFEELVGLIETSIGKMVPLITTEAMQEDPLVVFAEPYNELILDRQGFKGSIPEVAGLAPKENIQAWVDRKSFLHNLGHATAAYMGNFYHPHAIYLYEVLDDPLLLDFCRRTMHQSADLLARLYPHDFTTDALHEHIEDLLHRFRNRALKDTVFRVGRDRVRKLGPDDRFLSVIHLAIREGMPYHHILQAMAAAFYFDARDEQQLPDPQDVLFDEYLCNGLPFVLQKVCGLDAHKDTGLIKELTDAVHQLKGLNNP